MKYTLKQDKQSATNLFTPDVKSSNSSHDEIELEQLIFIIIQSLTHILNYHNNNQPYIFLKKIIIFSKKMGFMNADNLSYIMLN